MLQTLSQKNAYRKSNGKSIYWTYESHDQELFNVVCSVLDGDYEATFFADDSGFAFGFLFEDELSWGSATVWAISQFCMKIVCRTCQIVKESQAEVSSGVVNGFTSFSGGNLA